MGLSWWANHASRMMICELDCQLADVLVNAVCEPIQWLRLAVVSRGAHVIEPVGCDL